MWKILDPASHGESTDRVQDLFHPSLIPDSDVRITEKEYTAVEDLGTPSANMTSNSVENYTQPMDWFDATATASPNGINNSTLTDPPVAGQDLAQLCENVDVIGQDWPLAASPAPLHESETLIDMNDYPAMHLFDQSGDMTQWWNYGNL